MTGRNIRNSTVKAKEDQRQREADKEEIKKLKTTSKKLKELQLTELELFKESAETLSNDVDRIENEAANSSSSQSNVGNSSAIEIEPEKSSSSESNVGDSSAIDKEATSEGNLSASDQASDDEVFVDLLGADGTQTWRYY